MNIPGIRSSQYLWSLIKTVWTVKRRPISRGFISSLTPPRPGKDTWKYAVLYTLNGKSDGSSPQGNLVFDAGGNLYGATELGGDPNCLNGQTCGTVFELKRPNMNGGKWRFSVLHTFTGAPDGAQPFAGVTLRPKRKSLRHNLSWRGLWIGAQCTDSRSQPKRADRGPKLRSIPSILAAITTPALQAH